MHVPGYLQWVRYEVPGNKPVMSKPNASWMDIAIAELGIREVTGDGNNLRIQEYMRCVTGQALPDSVPWCSAFVAWCLNESGEPHTSSLRAKSWLQYGVPVVGQPDFGSIVVLQRGRERYQGHVGFLIGRTKESVYILGGNQSNEVNIKGFCPADVLAYRVPTEYGKERYLV